MAGRRERTRSGRKSLRPAESADGAVATLPGRSHGRQVIGEALVAAGHVSATDVEAALAQQVVAGGRVGALLVDAGAISDADLTSALSIQLGVDIADLGSESPRPEATALLTADLARALTAVPLRLEPDGSLAVVVTEPTPEVAQQLRTATGRDVRLMIAPDRAVASAVNQAYRTLSGIDVHVAAFTATNAARDVSNNKPVNVDEDAPVVRVVNLVLTQALRDRASDVHIEPQDQKLRVRFRIDGALTDVLELPADMGPALTSRLKIMAGMNIVERRRPQDGQIAMDIDGRAVDIRVATTGTIWGEKVVLRVLDKSKPLYRLNDLGMPVDTHATFSKLVRAPFGMVLCAGPTGSGKTTTLYATMSEINESQRNIMTIEDPVEYVFPSINQIQMNEQAGLTFATGLKSILRQDPDVILVGEIRDVETARIATQSALTGHFVLSSLHATDAVAALHRFLDMGIESFLIASSVLGVVGQRLVRRICTNCAEPYEPSVEEFAFYVDGGGKDKDVFYRGAGCNFCSSTGYADRIGVYELLTITPEIKRLVVGWATQDELRRMAVKQGMRTLRDEAIALVEQDLTTINEVIRNVYTA